MRVAVTSQGPDLTSQIDPRFGRARYLIVVDTDSGRFTAHDNATNLDAPQGAGIQAARKVLELGATAVITGSVGPNALATLRAARIDVYPGASGTVSGAIEQLKAGRFQPADKANADGHWA
jgi:predicted Fe-Mo cluster-binding NifX family protein